eukprot:6476478-Prymnesium_polylepis.1
MQAAISHQVELAHAAYASKPRPNWALEWPGMVSQTVSQIMWTANAEAALLSDDPNALRAYERSQSDVLEQFANLVRTQ